MSRLQFSAHVPPPSQESPDAPGTLVAAFAAGIFALAAFGVFVFPFFFPPTNVSPSVSYTVGFSNRVAEVAAAFVACLTFLIAWRFRLYPRTTPHRDARPTPRYILALCLAACAAFNAFSGWLLARTNLTVIDARYFLESLDDVIRYHLRIYSGFNFAYGPLLLYIPIWIHTILAPFRIGTQGAYYTALVLMQCLGLLMLHATLRALQVPRSLRIPAFILFTLTALNPVLGLNYTPIRSLLPFSTLIYATQVKPARSLAALFFLAELLQLAISPELGFAFAAGACFYAIARAIQSGPVYLYAAAAPPAAALLFLAAFGRAYLSAVFTFSAGDFNLIIEPLGYILFFLLCLVWIVPRMLAADFRRGHPQALLRASLFVLSVALLPAAFGRCDLLHVLYAGLGIYILAICAIASWSSSARNLWLVLFAGVILWTHFVNYQIRPHLRQAAAIVFRHAPGPASIDIARLRAITAGQPVFVPVMIPFSIEQQLKNDHLYAPDREPFIINVAGPVAESAKVARMDQYSWALAPSHIHKFIGTPRSISGPLGVGYTFYPLRQKPHISGSIITSDLQNHWTPAANFGKWILYRKVSTNFMP
jgi:hypothetical protein